MTKAKQITFGLLTGIALLITIGFFAERWLSVWLSDPSAIGDPTYLVFSPTSLDSRSIANDVWFWYETEGIDPVAIQRVEYWDTWAIGRKQWGYFLFFKGRVTDPALQTKIRNYVSATQQELAPIPNWVSHVPEWWRPEIQLSSDALPELKRLSRFVYARCSKEEVIVYWLREPHNGYI